MGKKRIIQKSEEELLTERERVDKAIKKQTETQAVARTGEGRIYIYSSYNNTIMSLADARGNVLSWTSAGAIGFKGSKKSTPYAASKVVELLVQKARRVGINKVKILVKGIGPGRESALRSLGGQGLEVTSVEDITPIPHNGCRPRRPRRV